MRVAVRDRDPRGGLAGKHSRKSVVNIGGKILFYLVLYGLSGKHSLKSAPSYICLSKSNLNSLLRTFSQPNVLRLVRALVDTPGRNSHQSEILNSQNLKFPQLRFFLFFLPGTGLSQRLMFLDRECLRGNARECAHYLHVHELVIAEALHPHALRRPGGDPRLPRV